MGIVPSQQHTPGDDGVTLTAALQARSAQEPLDGIDGASLGQLQALGGIHQPGASPQDDGDIDLALLGSGQWDWIERAYGVHVWHWSSLHFVFQRCCVCSDSCEQTPGKYARFGQSTQITDRANESKAFIRRRFYKVEQIG